MRSYNATGITLAAHKYGETGRVVHFFTAEYGKIEAIAQGVGKPGSKLAAAVEPLTISRLYFAKGRQLDRLTQAEVFEAFWPLRQDLKRLGYASVLLELTDLLTEMGAPVPGLFADLKAALETLTQGAEPEFVMGAYALRLLRAQGIAPELNSCVECGGPLFDEALYAPFSGGFICQSCSPETQGRMRVRAATIQALQNLSTISWESLFNLQLPQDSQREMAQILHSHLRFQLGVPLKSLKFLAQISYPPENGGGEQ